MKPQATKTDRPGVLLHISRQRALGQNMIRGTDRPRRIEILVATGISIAAIAFAAHRGWLSGWMS